MLLCFYVPVHDRFTGCSYENGNKDCGQIKGKWEGVGSVSS